MFITYTDLVHDSYTCIFDLLLKLSQRWRDVTRRDHVFLLLNRSLDNNYMMSGWNQTDDDINLVDSGFKLCLVKNIQGSGIYIFALSAQFLCVFECSTCCDTSLS